MENYSMYRFFKGEKSNPFDSSVDSLSSRFWQCEYIFETSDIKKETYELHSFFKDHGMEKQFMALITEKDHDYISEKSKKPVFELWLKYLFEFKIYPEYGGENEEKKIYYSIDL
jgi:hypothetical protein